MKKNNFVRIIIAAPAVALLVVGFGCASQPHKKAKGAQPQGAPRSPVSAEVLEAADAADPSARRPGEYQTMGKIVVPASYRLVFQDGNPVFIRETDARRLNSHPAVRLVASEQGSGEINLQPALLPQELAQEIITNRAQTQALMEVVPQLQQSVAVLGQQAETLAKQNREVQKLIISSIPKDETKD